MHPPLSAAWLRPATPADVALLVAVEIEAAGRFPLSVLPADVGRAGSPAEWAQAVADGLAWVACVPGPGECASAGSGTAHGIVGGAAAQVIGRSLHVVEMDVLPAFGRRGIGEQLLARTIAEGQARGLREVTLTTFGAVPWNAPFYARHGFRVVEPGAPQAPSGWAHLASALARESRRGLQDRVAMVRAVG